MTQFKLTYFDIDGGRGEPIRLALHIGGIEFEDVRLTFSEFQEARQSFRFHALPVLEIDGRPVTQSTSLARYVGKLVGLYPTDDLQALYCDEAMDARRGPESCHRQHIRSEGRRTETGTRGPRPGPARDLHQGPRRTSRPRWRPVLCGRAHDRRRPQGLRRDPGSGQRCIWTTSRPTSSKSSHQLWQSTAIASPTTRESWPITRVS